jgi:hypothetical protein
MNGRSSVRAEKWHEFRAVYQADLMPSLVKKYLTLFKG